MKDNASQMSLFDGLDLFGPSSDGKPTASVGAADVLWGNDPVPEWWIRKIGPKASNFLRKLCPEFRVGDVAMLSREKMSGYNGYGKATLDAIMELISACRDGTVWTPLGFHAKHANEFDSLSDMILQAVQDSVALNDTYLTVMRMNLGILDSVGCTTLEETGGVLHLTRERVRQLGKKVLENLKMAFSAVCFQELVAWSSKFFEERGMESAKDDFVDSAAKEFGWTKPTLFSLCRVLDELGFETVANPLTGLLAWNKDGRYDWIYVYKPLTPTEKRRAAIKSVLMEAGRNGLTINEIVSACQVKFADAKVGKGNVQGCFSNSGDLDGSGTKIIGLSCGKKGEGATRYTLNTFFQDEEIKSVLEKAGAEIRTYMEKTGFGVVDVWKTWIKYKDELPEEKRLPKLGFYMMMRDVSAGGLCYKDYPRVSYDGIDVCQNAYWWELYEYFHYCGHPKASFTQIMSFFIDCLGIQPNLALTCAFCSMGLKKDTEATDAQYVIKRPPIPSNMPTVLLKTVKKDEKLSLVKSDVKYTIHSDYIDENGRAIYHPTYVKMFLRELEKSGTGFSQEEQAQLMDAGWCKNNFKVPRAMLKKADGIQQEKGKGYWLEKFNFGNESFYVCDDWDQKNKAAFDAWAVNKAKQAGFEFVPYEIGGEDEVDEENMDDGQVSSMPTTTMSPMGDEPSEDNAGFSADEEQRTVGVEDGVCKTEVGTDDFEDDPLFGVLSCVETNLDEFRERYRRWKAGIDKTLLSGAEWHAIEAFEDERWEEGVSLAAETETKDVRLQCYLGYCYENGLGTAKDVRGAAEWYRKAAEQGDEKAQIALARMYEDGKGVAKSKREAVKWYTKAAEQGNCLAQFSLGFFHEFGYGVVENPLVAVEWYRKAAEQGDAIAQLCLGEMYEYGALVVLNYKEAAKWYRLAADQSEPDACWHLGQMYKFGLGVGEDVAEAKKWFRRAAELGCEAAKNEVELM